ncbi:hypothetical protein [Alicyclobacillus contaminans]|uniref:hypothetical protein n=1 Tax=Alicyclobacillus contaminans TaxID=392016 RepID=UPI0012EBE508|nr:hypothetical protein [Alicyclobacillus contaminans]
MCRADPLEWIAHLLLSVYNISEIASPLFLVIFTTSFVSVSLAGMSDNNLVQERQASLAPFNDSTAADVEISQQLIDDFYLYSSGIIIHVPE